VRRVAVELNFQAHNPGVDYQRDRIQFARVEFELAAYSPISVRVMVTITA